jgi:hypothetical protein
MLLLSKVTCSILRNLWLLFFFQNQILSLLLCYFFYSRSYTIMNSQNARIVLDGFKIVMHSSEAVAPVGILHPLAFHLENKAESCSSNGIDKTSEICKEKVGFVFEVQGDCLHRPEATCQSAAEVTKLDEVAERRLHISRTKNHNTFSICCWLQDSCETSAGRMMIFQ